MSNPVSGAAYFVKGLKLLNTPGIRRYVIVPLIINFIIFSSLLWFGAQQFSLLIEWMMSFLPDMLQWLSWLLWPLFIVSALLIGFFTFSLLANIIAAPFNSLLSEAVEKHISGQLERADSRYSSFFASILPQVLNEIRKVGYFLLWAIPFLILFIIPVVNFAAPIIWFLFTAWMMSLQYVDYPMGNREIIFSDIRKYVAQRRMSALGFGTAVNIAMMIPIFNFLVMPAAVAGATVLYLDAENSNS